MSKHSTLVGGSNCERVIHCPGSVPLSAGVPTTSSEYADEGTMLHDVIGKMLDEDKSADELLGHKYKTHEFTPQLSVEMIEPAEEAFDEIASAMGGITYEVEQTVNFGDFLPGAFGTADIVGRGKTESLVLDWKFGRGVEVSAVENYQMMFYASAARKTAATKDLFDPKMDVRCVIVQPAFGPPTQWVVTHDELDVFDLMLRTAVEKAYSGDAPLETGKWCRFCPAKSICPLKNELAGYALQQDIERELTPKELGELVDLAFEVEDWAKAVQKLAHGVLELGGVVDGYKLVDKRSKGRVCIDEEGIKKKLQRMGVKIDEYMPRTFGGVGMVETALKAHGLKPKQREPIMKKYFEKAPSSGTTLVEADDDRPASLVGKSGLAALAQKLTG